MKTTMMLQNELKKILGYDPYGAPFDKIIRDLLLKFKELEAENERLQKCQK